MCLFPWQHPAANNLVEGMIPNDTLRQVAISQQTADLLQEAARGA